MAIPKKIHLIWIQGFDKINPKLIPYVQSVVDHNPDYEIYKWDEQSLREEIKTLGDSYLQKLDSMRLLHQRVDYLRYLILYKYGGISVDTDAFAHKSFNETPHINDSDFIVSWNSENTFINNATILLSKGNPVMKEFIDSINPDCSDRISNFTCIAYSTGPMALTKFVKSHKDKITVLPNIYMEECSAYNKRCVLSDEIILDHRHEGSWISPFLKKCSRLYFEIKHYKNFIIAGILFILLLWAIYLITKK